MLVGLAVAGAAFGLASVVQAAIPDSNGIVTACYQTSTSGTPKGTMRAINAENGEFCRFNEAAVDLATPEYVQNAIQNAIDATSNAYYAEGGNVFSTGPGIQNTVDSITLPPGNYVIGVSGWAYNTTGAVVPTNVRCGLNGLHGSDVPDAFAVVGLKNPDAGETLALNGNVALPMGGTVTVKCLTDAPAVGQTGYGFRMTADQVVNVSGFTYLKPPGNAPSKAQH